MELFLYFFIYSFLGFLLEIGFARLVQAKKKARKCFTLLPLCPVYGLGALAILLLPTWVHRSGPLLILLGGLAATCAEYLMGSFYERVAGVSFWDYSHMRFHIRGRVCPLFSLFWGLLATLLIQRVHPVVMMLAARLPLGLVPSILLLLTADGIYTVALLRATGDTDSLRWYQRT